MAIEIGKVWLDGALVPYSEATVPVMTHTLHYGYGVFEGIRAYQRANGESHVFRLEEHTKRLFESAKILGMEIPYTEADINAACVDGYAGLVF